MQYLTFKKNARALVIVAHPDDETIWMGGTILKHPEVKWTIFSLCRGDDTDRAPKFFRVCKYLKTEGLMTNLEDEGLLNIKQSVPLIKKMLLQNLTNKNYNYIFTHGTNGEYGHARHKAVHRSVVTLVSKKNLSGLLLCFNYELTGEHKLKPKKNSHYIINLTPAEFDRKQSIMSDIYGFDKNGIDAGYCTTIEGFIKY
ncbi:MAG: PIG-L family deacetylase [Candidatus Magasanikbacteria bacterium CG10_big_fil_rev_8_21_14_0_10_40_10]|uniref:PIG-L family deacetylase n=1 Tax=Candidatus Magasanikbacteria bacterium CG10_big_fil_rev_8_21_14_0_10_40_10 TaxID=1974648 RepID=A0A2M6W2U2_9BACT|nr:MAG: PIG-L family deacetylase [Candidatus Magasanikbacteria bacterium CG10_big_fil_rev_8_21_14_0_10_40_10]